MNPTKALELSAAFGMLRRDEVLALADLVEKLPKGASVANIGAGFGTSALTVAEVRPDVELISVDIRDDNNPFGGLMNERNAFINAGIEIKHRQIKGDSPIVADEFPVQSFDLVIIDDDHTPQAAEDSITKWLSRVKLGGFLLIHDYDSVMWPQVKTVVDEIAEMFFLTFEWQEDTYICYSRPTVPEMKKKGKKA